MSPVSQSQVIYHPYVDLFRHQRLSIFHLPESRPAAPSEREIHFHFPCTAACVIDRSYLSSGRLSCRRPFLALIQTKTALKRSSVSAQVSAIDRIDPIANRRIDTDLDRWLQESGKRGTIRVPTGRTAKHEDCRLKKKKYILGLR